MKGAWRKPRPFISHLRTHRVSCGVALGTCSSVPADPGTLLLLGEECQGLGKALVVQLVMGELSPEWSLLTPLSLCTDDESDSDAEEEQTTVRDSTVPLWLL